MIGYSIIGEIVAKFLNFIFSKTLAIASVVLDDETEYVFTIICGFLVNTILIIIGKIFCIGIIINGELIPQAYFFGEVFDEFLSGLII